MSGDDGPPIAIRAGEILELLEHEYYYGTGAVRIRVKDDVRLSRDGWLTLVVGVQLGWNDSERPREVYVISSALRRHAMRHHQKRG